MAEKWYVCYCEPKKCLELVAELVALGLDADCPSFSFRRRVPRRKKMETIERPIIGGLFFLGVDSWPLPARIVSGVDLRRVRRMIVASKPALITDEDLSGLRVAAAERSHVKNHLRAGDVVEICSGPFSGKMAAVTSSSPDFVWVEVENFSARVQFPPFLLRKKQA